MNRWLRWEYKEFIQNYDERFLSFCYISNVETCKFCCHNTGIYLMSSKFLLSHTFDAFLYYIIWQLVTESVME